MATLRLGVDVGGTFTDLVVPRDGGFEIAKVPSTPADQSEGVMAAVASAALTPEEIGVFVHGMTVATNALLERRGARTALVTNEGFRDLLEIGRQDRPALYDLRKGRPPALVPRELRFTVTGRMGPEGELAPLDPESVERAVEAVARAEAEAVVVCLLFSFRFPDHERRVGAALAERLPGVHVTLSSEVLPEFREYERFSTAAASAYLAPRLSAYLEQLAARAEDGGLPQPLVMQSSGGAIGIADAASKAAACVLSGPAGGVVGAAYAAAASGVSDLLSFDMGGTSTDVAPVLGGRVATTTEARVAAVPIGLPMVDVHTVSAGGGSIAWADAGGALRVGPRSAGARPGPAAYGRGGEEPTVTDANLRLGLLADGTELGGELVLRRDLASAALERLGTRLGLDADALAAGIARVAEAEMARALRVISVERGLDPRPLALVAFGGAGGLHACALAEELGMGRVILPRATGVLSALGLAVADLRRDYVRPFLGELDGSDAELERAFAAMEERAKEDLDDPELRREADLRYRGQSFELTVDAGDPGALADRFGEEYERRYGYRMDGEPLELVALRLTASRPGERPELREEPARDDGEVGRREVHLDGGRREVSVFDRTRMGAGSAVTGPALVEFPEATCLVRPGWAGEVDAAGNLVLEGSG